MSEEQITEQPEVTETTTTEQPVEEAKGYTNSDGTFNRDAFGDLGEHSMFDKLQNIEEMAKAYANLEQLKGKKFDDILSSEDPDIQARLREIRGVPKESSGYEFNIDIPDSVKNVVSDERLSAVREKFKELDIPKEAAEALVKWDVENAAEAFQKQQEAYSEAVEVAKKELSTKWKNDTSNNIEKAANALDYLGLPDLANDVRDPQSPQAYKFAEQFYEKIVPLIENDEIIGARQTQTIATAKDRMDDLRSRMFQLSEQDKTRTPEYSKLISEMSELTAKVS